MNDRVKHQLKEQIDVQKADPKAEVTVFIFLPTPHFFNTILEDCTNDKLGFAPHSSRPSPKQIEPYHPAERMILLVTSFSRKISKIPFLKF